MPVLTWGKFKAQVEAEGVLDSDKIIIFTIADAYPRGNYIVDIFRMPGVKNKPAEVILDVVKV